MHEWFASFQQDKAFAENCTVLFIENLSNGINVWGLAQGDSHIKVTGVLVVSFRGVHCRFWSHYGCFGRKVTIFAHSGIA